MSPIVGVPVYWSCDPPLSVASSMPFRFTVAWLPPLRLTVALWAGKSVRSARLPPEASICMSLAEPSISRALPPDSSTVKSWVDVNSVAVPRVPPDSVTPRRSGILIWVFRVTFW